MRESITEKALHERDTAEPLEMHEVDGAQPQQKDHCSASLEKGPSASMG